MGYSEDGWARTRGEHGRNTVKFRAVCDLCPWVAVATRDSVFLAEQDRDAHCKSSEHLDNVLREQGKESPIPHR